MSSQEDAQSICSCRGFHNFTSEGLMEQVHIRQHDVNSNLWWVSSSSGDDVAYITQLGNSYFVWATEPAPAGIAGKRFDTVDAALDAVVKSVLQHC
jgi:hypothetical protein